jgi:hypothetical protein
MRFRHQFRNASRSCATVTFSVVSFRWSISGNPACLRTRKNNAFDPAWNGSGKDERETLIAHQAHQQVVDAAS